MSKEFLTQEEVDALLEGVTGEGEAATDQPAGVAGGVRAYNLAAPDVSVCGRMPVLESINERFTRALRANLLALLRRPCSVTSGAVTIVQYGEFMRALPAPANLNVVHLKPLRGVGLVIFESALIHQVVDTLFGGGTRFQPRAEGREFTHTETRIIQRLLAAVFECGVQAWQSVYPVKFEYLRSETDPQSAAIATPHEMAVVTTFAIGLSAETSANLHLCMPYAMYEPIRDQLRGSAQTELRETDARWPGLLAEQVQTAVVDLAANLATVDTTCGELLRLKVGDILPLELPPSIIAAAGGVPVLACRYGESGGRYALLVERVLGHADAALSSGH